MYLAKNDKTGYAVYNPQRDHRIYQRVSLASSMRQAIDARQFIVEYQPIVHVRSGTVLALESLVRWNHPELGRLLPDDFIRVAEHTGLVNPLTSFVLERALTDWPLSERPDSCSIAVNVSPRSLHHAAFPGRIREMLDAHGIPPSSLTLEITENLVMSDPDGSARCLDELHDMGVRLVHRRFRQGLLVAQLPAAAAGGRDQDRSLVPARAGGRRRRHAGPLHHRPRPQPRHDGGGRRRGDRGGVRSSSPS